MPKISKDYLIIIAMSVAMLVFWFLFAKIRWLIVLVSSIMLGLFLSHLFIAFVNNRVIRQFAFLNRQLRVHLDIPETDLFNFKWIYPSLQGRYLQRKIQVYTSTESVAESSREVPFTTISVDAPFGGRTFSIRPEALGKRFTKFFYNKSKVTQDKAFDRKFDVSSDDLEYIGNLLDGGVREILSGGILSRDSYLEFKNGKFSYTEQTVLNAGFKRRRFEKIILVMYMIAKKMEKGGRPSALPTPKREEVLPPELSELFEEKAQTQEQGFDEMGFDDNDLDGMDFDDMDLGMDDDDMFDYEEEEEDDMMTRKLKNEKEGTLQLDLFEEEGSRKLNTSNEDLFRDGIDDGGKLSEEGIDAKKEKEKNKEKEVLPEKPKKEEKEKPKPAPEPEPEKVIERIETDDFDFDFGAGDEDLSDLENMDFGDDDLGGDFNFDDMDFDNMDLDLGGDDDFDLDGMDFDDMNFDDDDFFD